MSNSNSSAGQQSANQETTPNQNPDQQQRVLAVPSNRLPPVGIVMPNLSLRPRSNPNQQVSQPPPLGIVMPDLSLRPRGAPNEQGAQTPQTSAAQRQAPTAQEIIAAKALMQMSRAGQDGRK